MSNLYTKNELYHWGVKGMRWGVRRYQNKDGTLTPLGKQRLAESNIRTEENLVAKTIPKGAKMYRVTPDEKDGNTSKVKYVSYTDVDRNLYKEGSIVRKYTGKEDPTVYEHEYTVKSDIRVPSLTTVRDIEKKIMESEQNRLEVAKSWVEERLMADGYVNPKTLAISNKVSAKLDKATTNQQREKIYNETIDKYGDDGVGDDIMFSAYRIADAKKWVDDYTDSKHIEQSLGRATNTKSKIIKELQKQGYNAMYDNASIGVESDGSYSKRQEGIEPLIIFDADSTLSENTVRKIDQQEQEKSWSEYEQWKNRNSELLRKFK